MFALPLFGHHSQNSFANNLNKICNKKYYGSNWSFRAHRWSYPHFSLQTTIDASKKNIKLQSNQFGIFFLKKKWIDSYKIAEFRKLLLHIICRWTSAGNWKILDFHFTKLKNVIRIFKILLIKLLSIIRIFKNISINLNWLNSFFKNWENEKFKLDHIVAK